MHFYDLYIFFVANLVFVVLSGLSVVGSNVVGMNCLGLAVAGSSVAGLSVCLPHLFHLLAMKSVVHTLWCVQDQCLWFTLQCVQDQGLWFRVRCRPNT